MSHLYINTRMCTKCMCEKQIYPCKYHHQIHPSSMGRSTFSTHNNKFSANLSCNFSYVAPLILYFISCFAVSTASQLEQAFPPQSPPAVTNNTIPFSYNETTGKGPSKWGQLNPQWRACGDGKLQSPIDLDDTKVVVEPSLGDLRRGYKPAPATIVSRGRDIAVTWKGDAGKIQIYGMDYDLRNCHWHTPSEHTYNGKRYDLELHLVHNNSRGEFAVVGILYQYGEPDPFLSKLLPSIKTVTKQEKDLGILNPAAIRLRNRRYYRYNGSLSVPPCTEGVLWTLIQKVRTVSVGQVQALRDAVDADFQENARPIQSVYGRVLCLYHPPDIGHFS